MQNSIDWPSIQWPDLGPWVEAPWSNVDNKPIDKPMMPNIEWQPSNHPPPIPQRPMWQQDRQIERPPWM